MRADPDGTLWVGSGDGAEYAYMDRNALRTFDEQSLSGKLLHVDRDGRGLLGHRFCPLETDLTKVCTKLYAKGFRNPFRFQLRPGSTPVVGDVGWDISEELDFVEPGRSYGWPCYEGPNRTAHYEELPQCQAQYASDPPSQTPPDYHYERPYGVGGAIVAGPRYTGTRYPEAGAAPGSSATTPRAGSRPTTSSAASPPKCARSRAPGSRASTSRPRRRATSST